MNKGCLTFLIICCLVVGWIWYLKQPKSQTTDRVIDISAGISKTSKNLDSFTFQSRSEHFQEYEFIVNPRGYITVSGVAILSKHSDSFTIPGYRAVLPENPATLNVIWGDFSPNRKERTKAHLLQNHKGFENQIAISLYTDNENIQKAAKKIELGDAVLVQGYKIEIQIPNKNINLPSEQKMSGLTVINLWVEEIQIGNKLYL